MSRGLLLLRERKNVGDERGRYVYTRMPEQSVINFLAENKKNRINARVRSLVVRGIKTKTKLFSV